MFISIFIFLCILTIFYHPHLFSLSTYSMYCIVLFCFSFPFLLMPLIIPFFDDEDSFVLLLPFEESLPPRVVHASLHLVPVVRSFVIPEWMLHGRPKPPCRFQADVLGLVLPCLCFVFPMQLVPGSLVE